MCIYINHMLLYYIYSIFRQSCIKSSAAIILPRLFYKPTIQTHYFKYNSSCFYNSSYPVWRLAISIFVTIFQILFTTRSSIPIIHLPQLLLELLPILLKSYTNQSFGLFSHLTDKILQFSASKVKPYLCPLLVVEKD